MKRKLSFLAATLACVGLPSAQAGHLNLGVLGGLYYAAVKASEPIAGSTQSNFIDSHGFGPIGGLSLSLFQDIFIGLRLNAEVARLNLEDGGSFHRSTTYMVTPVLCFQFELWEKRHSLGIGPLFLAQASAEYSVESLRPYGRPFEVAGVVFEGRDWLKGGNEARGFFLAGKGYISPRLTQSIYSRSMLVFQLGYDF